MNDKLKKLLDETVAQLPKSVLTKHQKRQFRKDVKDDQGRDMVIIAQVRHDDECGNGHNSFSITAKIYLPFQQRGEPKTTHLETGETLWLNCCGCCHDEVAKHFPELAPLLKWHLTSTDSPMHYVANTVYLAGDRDYNGKRKGERYHLKGREQKRIVFGDFPITFEFPSKFVSFIETVTDWQTVEVVAVPYVKKTNGTDYDFEPKWTVTGYAPEWHYCPFDKKEEAEEFLAACRRFKPAITIFQDKWTEEGKGKERELDSARRAAVWPEATDEQLSVEPDELREVLIRRLPALMAEFKRAVESLGFTY